MGLMGVRDFDQLPSDEELGPPGKRCCHGCMEQPGEFWSTCIHDDLTMWRYPFCWWCYKLSIFTSGANRDGWLQRDPTKQELRLLDRIDQWMQNYLRWRETTGNFY